jgi:hypothetical protein
VGRGIARTSNTGTLPVFPDYGPAIYRGFFDAYRDRSRDLLILQPGRRLTEVLPPLVAKAEELDRAAGKAAAARVFDGNTPEEEYQRVLRGIAGGDPAVLGATEPPRDRPRGRVRPRRPRPRPRHRAWRCDGEINPCVGPRADSPQSMPPVP